MEMDKTVIVYRHKIVVFDVISSPFYLTATIAYYLDSAPDYLKKTAVKLKKLFYADNCVISVSSVEYMEKFMSEGKEIMRNGMFDLGRCWERAPVKRMRHQPLRF